MVFGVCLGMYGRLWVDVSGWASLGRHLWVGVSMWAFVVVECGQKGVCTHARVAHNFCVGLCVRVLAFAYVFVLCAMLCTHLCVSICGCI